MKPEWVQAFIDGQGSFQFLISNTTNRGKPYLQVYARLEIGQSNHDVKLLISIQNFFKGYIKPKYDYTNMEAAEKSRIVNSYINTDNYVVIDFVDKYPMLTSKRLDYIDWKKLIHLKREGAHKTIEGRYKIFELTGGMNANRYLKHPNYLKSTTFENGYLKNASITKRSYHINNGGKNNNNKFFKSIWKYIKKISYAILLILLALLAFIGYLWSIGEDELSNPVDGDVECSVKDINNAKPENNAKPIVVGETDNDTEEMYWYEFESESDKDSGNRGLDNMNAELSDIDLIAILLANLEAYFSNGTIDVSPVYVEDGVNINNVTGYMGCTYENNSDKSMTVKETELYEKLIREIRSGNAVSIYSPSSDSSEHDSYYYDIVPGCSGEPPGLVKRYEDSEDLTGKMENIVKNQENNMAKDKIYMDDIEQGKVKNLIIITKPCGDVPMPLPSWTEVENPPNHDHPDRHS